MTKYASNAIARARHKLNPAPWYEVKLYAQNSGSGSGSAGSKPGVVEQAAPHEVAEHAALDGAREPFGVVGAEAGGLVEAE